jgi:hypothetical protein
MNTRGGTRRRRDGLAILGLAAALAAVASVGQPYWPATWIDEGFVTNGAETVLEHGVYAMWSSEGPRVLDQPLIANGPGIVLPVAVAMRVLGVGLEPARTVAGLFLVLCGLIVYVVTRRLEGPGAGLAAAVLVAAMPREGLLYFGRMAMGNVPALVYFFTGVLVWAAAVQRRHTGWAAAAGLLFGLAAITKGQWSVVLVPALVLVWLIECWQGGADHRRHAAAMAGTVAMIGAWYAVRLALLGPEGFARDLAAVQSSARWTVFAFDPVRRTPGSLWFLARSGIAVTWLLGVGYAVLAVRERRPDAGMALLLTTVATTWLGWYALVSVGWERYAFEPFVMSAVLAGGATATVSRWWVSAAAPHPWRWPASTLVVLLALFTAAHGYHRGRDLVATRDTAAQDFAADLQRLVGPAEPIESWEWQLDVLGDQLVHHPPNVLVDLYTARIFFDAPVDTAYDWRASAPRYLVDGPLSKFTGVYARDLAAGCCERLVSRGPYDLYRVRPWIAPQRLTR